jgi:hypothetical protein
MDKERAKDGDTQGATAARKKLAICMPVFGDRDSAEHLLENLDRMAIALAVDLDVLLVDDGTPVLDFEPMRLQLEDAGARGELSHLSHVWLLKLQGQVGAQRAAALGLVHLFQHEQHDLTLVMASDGIDRTEDITVLLEHASDSLNQHFVIARPSARSDSLIMRALRPLLRLAQRALIGEHIELSGFCLFPRSVLASVVGSPELWNHYAAAVQYLKLPSEVARTHRGKAPPRISSPERSQLRAAQERRLAKLRALSVFSEVIAARLFTFSSWLSFGLLVAVIALLGARVWLEPALSDWFIAGAALLTALALPLGALSLTLALSASRARGQQSVQLLSDYPGFIADLIVIPTQRPSATRVSPSEAGSTP